MVPSGLFFFLSIVIVSVFSFVSMVVWIDARRKEREAYYRGESDRRVAESTGEGAKYLMEMKRDEERARKEREQLSDIKKVHGMKIGGLVNIGVGLGLMIFLYFLTSDNRGGERFVYLVGLIPGLIGVALVISGMMLTPRQP